MGAVTLSEVTSEMLEGLTPTQQQQFVAAVDRFKKQSRRFAEQQNSITIRPQSVQLLTVDLTNGYPASAPFEISFPFKGLWVYNASDTITTASLVLHSREAGHIANGIPIQKNFLVNFDEEVGQAYITATAQSGKILYILLLAEGKIDPGLTISQNSGGVSINEGSGVTTRVRTGLTLTTVTAVELLPTNTLRIVETIQNWTGQTIWVGGSTVTDDTGNYPGIRVDHGDTFIWKNTAALYAYNPGATISDAKVSRTLET